MKVLWVSLVEFPPLSKKLGKKAPSHCGWLYSSAKAIMKMMPDLELGVIVYSYGSEFEEYDLGGIKYYLVPTKSMTQTDKRQIASCKEAIRRFSPDILHIHGTEYSLACAALQGGTRGVPVISNIQGLAGGIARFADGGLSLKDKWLNITPLDFYRGTFILNAISRLRLRAKCEDFVLKHTTNIIGRTQWDHDHVISVNPKLHYHFMNETLRDSFYEKPIWSLGKCKKHTIFVSNSGDPLKGAHQVVKALPIILREYPDTVVNFCGSSVMSNELKTLIHFQGYHLYLRRLVKKMGVEEHVRFLGSLSELEMKQAYLDANVYVMPSAIENSSNSLCEAQILGVPVVASYCGGTPTLVKDGKTGFLYRYEEIEMLAQKIITLFGEHDFHNLSENERKVALERHNKERNAEVLKDIYKEIITRHHELN